MPCSCKDAGTSNPILMMLSVIQVEVRPDDLQGTRTVSFEVTRDDFERVNKDMFAKVLAPLEKVIDLSPTAWSPDNPFFIVRR